MKFITRDGFTIRGEVASYFTSKDGTRMVRLRVTGSPICVVARLADLLVEA